MARSKNGSLKQAIFRNLTEWDGDKYNKDIQTLLERGIDKQNPFGVWKQRKYVAKWFDRQIDINSEVVIDDKDYDSSWIDGRVYDSELGILAIKFNPFATNGKQPVILGMVGSPVPGSFVQAFDGASSKGQFYLTYIAQFKWVNKVQVENPTKLFEAVEAVEFFEVETETSEYEIPPRIYNSIREFNKNFKRASKASKNLEKQLQKYTKMYVNRKIGKLKQRGLQKLQGRAIEEKVLKRTKGMTSSNFAQASGTRSAFHESRGSSDGWIASTHKNTRKINTFGEGKRKFDEITGGMIESSVVKRRPKTRAGAVIKGTVIALESGAKFINKIESFIGDYNYWVEAARGGGFSLEKIYDIKSKVKREAKFIMREELKKLDFIEQKRKKEFLLDEQKEIQTNKRKQAEEIRKFKKYNLNK